MAGGAGARSFPLAYHITFGTYGTRLHGDPRGTVDRRRNEPEAPIVGRQDAWRRLEAGRLKHPPIVLNESQRRHAESVLPDICKRGGWACRRCACGPDHVHVLLSARTEGAAVRRRLKRWLGEALSARWPLPAGASWWADSGSVRWVWDEEYLRNVANYLQDQRTTD